MKAHSTIPASLEDWLRSFRSSLENHPFPQEIVAGGDQDGGRLSEVECAEPLPSINRNDNLAQSFVV